MEVAGPAMRAVALGTGGDMADLEFTYEGPTAENAPLANGELRRQIGLKLRAADSCNLVYVMWRLEPSSGIAVSVKRNPGMSESKQCRDGGYHTVSPTHGESVPSIHAGETHSLRAELSGATLRVFTDGRLAWEGDVGEETLAFDGPVGIRTDNGRFVFRVAGEPGAQPGDCKRGSLVASG
ncbi:MAG TPA: hypothetical protein VLF14_05080 [Candidatus Binatia bacterium]|nr:hypothetical protein [Candidatus Binatia bacterium]